MSHAPPAAHAHAPWGARLEQIQRHAGDGYRVLVCGGAQIRAAVESGLTDADGPLVLVPGPGCPASQLGEDSLERFCELARRPEILACAPEWVVRQPGFAARQGAEAVWPVRTPLEALSLVARHPDRHVVLLANGGESEAQGLALVAYQARELRLERFSMLLDLRLSCGAAAAALAGEAAAVDAVVLPQAAALLPELVPQRLAASWGRPVALAGSGVASLVEAVAATLGLDALAAPAGERPRGDALPSRWLLEQVFRAGPGRWSGCGEVPGSLLQFTPAFRFLDAAQLFFGPAGALRAAHAGAPPLSPGSSPCRRRAVGGAELCRICLPAGPSTPRALTR